jgi:hypothetical protein
VANDLLLSFIKDLLAALFGRSKLDVQQLLGLLKILDFLLLLLFSNHLVMVGYTLKFFGSSLLSKFLSS